MSICKKCSYLGCDFSRAKYGFMGHYIWMLDLHTKSRKWLNPIYAYRQFKRYWTALDYSQISDVEVDGIDTRDYPDFCDAFIASATYKGREMSEAELERLNEDGDYIYGKVQDRLY